MEENSLARRLQRNGTADTANGMGRLNGESDGYTSAVPLCWLPGLGASSATVGQRGIVSLTEDNRAAQQPSLALSVIQVGKEANRLAKRCERANRQFQNASCGLDSSLRRSVACLRLIRPLTLRSTRLSMASLRYSPASNQRLPKL